MFSNATSTEFCVIKSMFYSRFHIQVAIIANIATLLEKLLWKGGQLAVD